MARVFNTSGPCNPGKHYMLPAEERLSDARRLIDLERYFVLHAPRQTGKTTTVAALVASLAAEGRYAALLVSCEEAQAVGENIDRGIALILNQIEKEAIAHPESLRPPPAESVARVDGAARLGNYLTLWAERSPRPLVLFLDEIDSIMGKTLISVLRQLRVGYRHRPARFPQSVALVGMRDVRDYKIAQGEVLHTASPHNIKDRSFLLANFTAEEVATLLEQHTAETGQIFTDEVKAGIWELTRGQPWLVNGLAQQLVDVEVADRTKTITADHLDVARDKLIERRETHLDSLLDRLTEGRVERIIAPILAGEVVLGDRLQDDVAYALDLGIVDRSSGQLEIANPIYQEVIPRALATGTQYGIPYRTEWYLTADGRLDMSGLLAGFLDFWHEHGEAMMASQPYREVAFQLVVMSFLQRV
ncbi:MAG: AAA family ATPase, partial [bacterium]|nr:AAA family ATPase [bacterium]